MQKDSIGNRMKANYEQRYDIQLTRRIPVVIRLDGKAFHTFTRNLERPFSSELNNAMISTVKALMNNVQGAKIAYVQSDEISILLTDYDHLYTEAWFNYKLQKMTSVSASIATAYFNYYFNVDSYSNEMLAMFDSRAFNIPKEEVSNYFLWRWQDWKRNSVQLLGQSLFSHNQLHGKNQQDIKIMCREKGYDWDALPNKWKYGTFVDNRGHEYCVDFSDRIRRVKFDQSYVNIGNT